MRAQPVRPILYRALIFGVLCACAPGLASALDTLTSLPAASAWEASPYRNFGGPESIWNGRATVRDEGRDSSLPGLLSTELRRLSLEIQDKQGWRLPVADGDPLRILIARKDAEGVRRVAVRAVERGHLVSPAIQLDATGMTNPQIAHEVGRLYAFATLAAYDVPDRTFLTSAAADYLAGYDGVDDSEAALSSAAASSIDLSKSPAGLGRLYVEEFAREAGGPDALRAVWERAAQTGEEPLPLLLDSFTEATGLRSDALMQRFAARLYATLETEPSPSRVSLADLMIGGLDASTPAVFALRHRVFLPGPEPAAAALRLTWPEQGSGGAVVVRYWEASLPADVVFLAPGAVRTIPLSGVARVDFAITGSIGGLPVSGAPALVETVAAFPYAGLTAQAVPGPGGSRVSWTTTAHEDLAGWVVFREEVLPDGRIARSGPEIVPSSNKGDESFRYVYVDSAASPGTFYRYTIWAVTQDGLMARAFSATLRAD